MTKQTVDKALRAHLKARAKAGKAKYNQELYAFNGRKPAYDRLEELLDAAVYSMQDIMERERLADRLAWWGALLNDIEAHGKWSEVADVAGELTKQAADLRKDTERAEPEEKFRDGEEFEMRVVYERPPGRIDTAEELYGPATTLVARVSAKRAGSWEYTPAHVDAMARQPLSMTPEEVEEQLKKHAAFVVEKPREVEPTPEEIMQEMTVLITRAEEAGYPLKTIHLKPERFDIIVQFFQKQPSFTAPENFGRGLVFMGVELRRGEESESDEIPIVTYEEILAEAAARVAQYKGEGEFREA